MRATQYLPDIVRLQQHLYDSFHHRLDRREAKHITIREFLQGRKSGRSHEPLLTMHAGDAFAWVCSCSSLVPTTNISFVASL